MCVDARSLRTMFRVVACSSAVLRCSCRVLSYLHVLLVNVLGSSPVFKYKPYPVYAKYAPEMLPN